MSTPGEDCDDTIIGLVEPATPSPRVVPGPVVTVLEPTVRWSVRVRGTSTIVPLDRPVDVGRRPGRSRIDEHPTPRRLTISDQRGEVSARHVRIEQIGETLVVHDLGSTNGVVVHWATGASRQLRRRESIAVLPDTVIMLAEGVELDFSLESATGTDLPART